eukprot:5696939-Amphidinium_carterae.2
MIFDNAISGKGTRVCQLDAFDGPVRCISSHTRTWQFTRICSEMDRDAPRTLMRSEGYHGSNPSPKTISPGAV